MTVTTSYPGIYLIEDASPNFSVTSSATAVPVFAYNDVDNLPAGEDIQIYYSWAEVTAAQKPAPGLNYYESIKTWFMNGGGKCYLAEKSHIYEAVTTYDDITLIVAAGRTSDILTQFNTLISEGYKIFALLDSPEQKITTADSPEKIMADYPTTSYAAVFYPWFKVTGNTADFPPSAVAAAAIAKTDRSRGVWKAPANVVIDGVVPQYPVTDDLQGLFNQGKALNMIRTFPGVGTVVWGARTLEDSDNWRYIPVRRLFNTVEGDIKKALRPMIFEPNNQLTWKRVHTAIDHYLYSLWQQGGLLGNKAEEAYFVRIGEGITMTTDDINQGKLIVQVGMAAVRPAEFIILQFTQDMAQ